MPDTEKMPLRQLMPGQCFFFMPPDTWAAREKEVNEIEEFRLSVGMPGLSSIRREIFLRSFAEAHIIDTFSRHTGDYFTTRLNDDKRMIWYDPNIIVDWSHDPKSFERRREEMRKAKKEIAEAQANMQKARSKKKSAPTEIEERTVRMGA